LKLKLKKKIKRKNNKITIIVLDKKSSEKEERCDDKYPEISEKQKVDTPENKKSDKDNIPNEEKKQMKI